MEDLDLGDELKLEFFAAVTVKTGPSGIKRLLKAIGGDPDIKLIYKRVSPTYLYITNRRPEGGRPE